MKNIKFNTFLSLLLISLTLISNAQDTEQNYAAILQKWVTNGAVDYNGLKDEKSNLDNYVETLVAGPAVGSSEAEEMAFWINAYNAITLKLVIDNYPIGSIRDLHNGNPWDVKIITIAGESLSLNEIEKDKLIRKYKDARVHFAINCAAKSCPALSNRLFSAANLEGQLEDLTRSFLSDTDYDKGVSKIFEWYAADFGDVADFIARYSEKATSRDLKYQGYDWALNSL